MNYIICVAAAVGSFFLAWRTLDLKTVRSSRLLRSRHPEDEEMGKQLGPQQILALALLLTLADIVTVWRLFLTVHDPLNLLKLSLALVILTGCACVDGVEHRIPNFLSGTLALSALALLAAGFLTGQTGAFGYLQSSLFAAAVTAACLVVGAVLSHQGIGAGDIKLLAALGLMGGVTIVGGTIFFAMLPCALVSAGLLITKKKTMREAIPFGPFLLIGYMLTIWILKF